MSHLCVFATSRVPEGIRGAMNQWCVEVLAGVFVGTLPARVRDALWDALSAGLAGIGSGYACLVRAADTDQGFEMLVVGDCGYLVQSFDGLQLVTRSHRICETEDAERAAIGFAAPQDLADYDDF